MNYYRHIIARLDGKEIEGKLDLYRQLVEKGISGFIIFGGDLDAVRWGIAELQEATDLPLIIASDMEQGVGQQLRGGTLFPPAMALAGAIDAHDPEDMRLLEEVFAVYAEEALYAGINTILAPVVDINTNPRNPVISVRSFGEDREIVSLLSSSMIETLQDRNVIACAKHFPGHGDSDTDSHLTLPVLRKDIRSLEETDLYPFRKAIERKVKTVMLGHISVPSLDSEGIPVSVSGKAVNYVRENLGFSGLLMTDALNMGGLSSLGQHKAAAMALEGGVDILLHPDDPDALNGYLTTNNIKSDTKRIEWLRRTLPKTYDRVPDFKENAELSRLVTERSVTFQGFAGELRFSSIVLVKDDEAHSYGIFEGFIRKKYHDLRIFEIKEGDKKIDKDIGNCALTVIFSMTAPWKGNVHQWFDEAINIMKERTQLFIIFGNPYVVHGLKKPKVLTYWCSEQSEKAVVKIFKHL